MQNNKIISISTVRAPGVFAQSESAQLADSKRKPMTRANVSAAKMAPYVRDLAARETFYRRDSGAVAKSYGNRRMNIVDCGLVDLDARLSYLEQHLGLSACRRAA